jgi:hypothetical protein
MVIAPASTGRDRSSRRSVLASDHTNSGIRSGFWFYVDCCRNEVTAARLDDGSPATCKEKTARYAHRYAHE